MGVIPIVNENDTLAVEEIKFGDNDTLSAITAAMIHADLLFLMTDVDCLYNKNPRQHPDAEPIEIVQDISTLEADSVFPPLPSSPFPSCPFFLYSPSPSPFPLCLSAPLAPSPIANTEQSPVPALPSGQAACRPRLWLRAWPPRPA